MPTHLTKPDRSAARVVRRRRRSTASASEPVTQRAALYVRVSTEEQAREGVSLDAQAARLAAYATAHGFAETVLYRDVGVSGSVPLGERPAGAELLAAIAAGAVQHVLAFKLDRLFRDAVDCLRTVRQWDDAGVAMHLVDLGGQAVNTGSAVGRFFLGMLAGVAELERNLIAERTSAALRHKIARGERVGGPPLGWAAIGDGTAWVPLEEEQAVLSRMREMRTRGATLAQIADTLATEGVPTKTKRGRWHPTTVRRSLLSQPPVALPGSRSYPVSTI